MNSIATERDGQPRGYLYPTWGIRPVRKARGGE